MPGETLYFTGQVGQGLTFIGNTGSRQIVATGTVAAAGPPGPPGQPGPPGAPGSGGGVIASVNNKTGVVVLTQDDIASGSTNKAYTATEQAKLAGISGTNTGDQDLSGYATAAALTSGLSSTEKTANKNAANGYAGLDGTGKVAAAQLPSYVDDVLDYANFAAFPGTGSTGIIYVADDTNKTYRWSGSSYIEISASPGSTDAIAEGTTNLYYTSSRAAAAAPVQTVAGRTGAIVLAESDIANLTTDLAATEKTANKNIANGYAGLDGTGKVPAAQLPSYVDDVLDYANLAAFPGTGSSGIIYVADDTNKTYRWSGSSYVEISASPGSTDAVTEGATNLYYTAARADARIAAATTAVQTLSNKRITKRVATTASSATPTPAGDSTDVYVLTAQAAAGAFANPTGTPTDGQQLLVRIASTGAFALTYGTAYLSSGVATLPTTTVSGKTISFGLIYDAAVGKWICMAVDATGY